MIVYRIIDVICLHSLSYNYLPRTATLETGKKSFLSTKYTEAFNESNLSLFGALTVSVYASTLDNLATFTKMSIHSVPKHSQ